MNPLTLGDLKKLQDQIAFAIMLIETDQMLPVEKRNTTLPSCMAVIGEFVIIKTKE